MSMHQHEVVWQCKHLPSTIPNSVAIELMAQIIAIDLYSLSQPVKSKQHFPNSIKSLNHAGFFLNLQQPNIVGFFAFAYLLYILYVWEKRRKNFCKS